MNAQREEGPSMYTEEDVKKIFAQRGNIEMELGVYRAQYYKREESIPPDILLRIIQLERDLMTIDSLFHALSTNEKLVVRLHVMEQLDWPQVLREYVNQWGEDSEKTIRSLQICQTKAIRKVAQILNRKIGFQCISTE